jgi:acetolactate synthase I/II/III large subunit
VTGAERLCRALETLGVETVFGLPGTQNVALFEALRKSRLRTIVATHELSASFMANGYARASGRPGVLLTIPGPGFTYSLTGLAEALLDSVPVMSIVGRPAEAPGRRFQLQALDQRAVVAPLVKRVFDLESAESIEATLEEAHAICQAGEPGPVVVQVSPGILSEEAAASQASSEPHLSKAPAVDEIALRLSGAQRVVLYVGQGANGAAAELLQLMETLKAPLVTTTSGRGVVPEDNPWVLSFDRRSVQVLNELVESASLVLALGCKFSHNGAHGFRLRLAPDRLIHVDASESVLGANYDASLSLAADVPSVIRALLDRCLSLGKSVGSGFSEEEVGQWRRRIMDAAPRGVEATIRGARPESIEGFFAALRRAMPADSCLVLDSGWHQMMARRYFSVLRPRGLILPTDLQAMGFALPAAIGARLAREDRAVVALLGDGGFAMSGLELLTAVREQIPLTVIVFNDGVYGAISRQQLATYGHLHGTELQNPDFRRFAESVGTRYVRLTGDIETVLSRAIGSGGVWIVEVVLRESVGVRLQRLRGALASRVESRLRFGRPSS